MNNLVQPTQARSVMKMAELIQRGPNRPTAKVAAIVPSRPRLGDLVTCKVPVNPCLLTPIRGINPDVFG